MSDESLAHVPFRTATVRFRNIAMKVSTEVSTALGGGRTSQTIITFELSCVMGGKCKMSLAPPQSYPEFVTHDKRREGKMCDNSRVIGVCNIYLPLQIA